MHEINTVRRGKLEYNWVGKNIDLNVVKSKIEEFLKEHNYKMEKNESPSSITWRATLRHHNRTRQIIITLTGKPDDVKINFKGGQGLDHLLKTSFLMQFLGASVLLRESYESLDFYKETEEKFWRKMEEAFG
jgi:tRNA(Ile)-lysidine synthase TilS/MesJ